jgi:5'-nucleotidase
MKRTLYTLCLILMLAPAGLALYNRYLAQREFVILSTNDLHASIKNFPRLATAVKECRDTVATLLVDAGDRWTGNAFVDLAPEPRKPIIDLMNELGYDVVTFGNHEFDGGSDFLRDMLSKQKFATVCANIEVFEGDFPQVPPYVIVEVDGARVGIAGAVTNYANGYPDGKAESFVGLRFPDPQQRAGEVAAELKDKCDVAVLLSHMGWVKDMELAAFEEALARLDDHAKRQAAALMAAAELVMTGKTRAGEGEVPFAYQVGGWSAELERFTFDGDPDWGSLVNYRLQK